MLILTRKVGESILIGDDIQIILTDIKRGSVRIGITAPKGLPVYRKEVHDRILKENQKAANHVLTPDSFENLNKLFSNSIGAKK